MNGEIVAVLFDAVGTLLYADPPVAEVYHAAASRYGSRLATNQIRDRFRHALTQTQRVRPSFSADADDTGIVQDRERIPTPSRHSLARLATTEQLEFQQWQRIVKQVIDDVSASIADQLFTGLWQHFAKPTSWRLFDDVASLWHELNARGYQLGIASNFDSRLRTVLAGLPPLDDCQYLFISSEIGFPKPDPRFFQAIQQNLALQPSQILIVGDDWTNDIVGAQAAGWSSVWIDRGEVSERPDRIASLTELLELLPARR